MKLLATGALLQRWQAARRRGQATVEAALILPLMVFMLLGIVQLTMMHQARLMTEYAAYNACRAGIVWNMDKDRMTRAALISLMPTFAATDTIAGENDPHLGRRPGLVETWAKMRVLTAGSAALNKLFAGLGMSGAGMEFIKVTVLNPTKADFGGKPEIHFDDFLLGGAHQARNRELRKATRLTVRVRYLYWMRIPFANWIIHTAWLAGQAGVVLNGPIDQPEVNLGLGVGLKGAARDAYIAAKIEDDKPFDEEGDRANLFRGLMLLGRTTDYYFIPIYSTYTMRMQSNPFVDNADL